MGKNNRTPNTPHDIITQRRSRVSALRLRGLTQRQIWSALAHGDATGAGQMLNARTGKPFSLGSINKDIQTLEDEWRKDAARNTDIHQGRQLAEIQLIKTLAFNRNDPELALKAVSLEMKLLGTSAPARSEVAVIDWRSDVLELLRKGKITPEQAREELGASLADELFREAGLSNLLEQNDDGLNQRPDTG